MAGHVSIVDELATLAARHKLVPFLGAGCSAAHLNLDWDKIRDDMAKELGTEHPDHALVAQAYEDKFGRAEFCKFLEKRLFIDEFEDQKGIADLLVMGLQLGVLYSTNQDNVFEVCSKKYGRPVRVIVTLDDLSEYLPGERVYIKYHGDPRQPDSVVFSAKDYERRRTDLDHFFNIRLRSDVLAKRFLFIGYSFRDPNIRDIFADLKAAFRGKLPPSYLVAFTFSPELVELGEAYNLTIINPRESVSDAASDKEAFEKFLTLLLDSSDRAPGTVGQEDHR